MNMEAFGISGYEFGVIGMTFGMFGLVAFSKLIRLEEHLKNSGVLD